MSNKLKIVLVVLILAIVAVVAVNHFHKKGLGTAIPTNCAGSVTCFTDVAANNVYTTNTLWLGDNVASTSVRRMVTAGQCNVASTTLFAVQNPFNATATVSMIITGIGQASSSNLTVGTSSALLVSGFQQKDLSGYLAFNLGPAIATTTQFTIRSGQVTALGTGQVQAGTSTSAVVPSILVGPTEYLGAFSTSTYPISGAVAAIGNYVPGLACTYKLSWEQ